MQLYPRRGARTQRDKNDDPEKQEATTLFHRSPCTGCPLPTEQVAGLLTLQTMTVRLDPVHSLRNE